MAEAVRRLRQPLDGAALFNRITSTQGLLAGWRKVAENNGAAGGDGVSIERFGSLLGVHIAALASDIRTGNYKPGPLRRVEIPKKSGGVRVLSIPPVVDRVAQSAVAQELGAGLEAEFEDASYAYRPGRGVADAVRRIEALRRQGYIFTLEADIDSYFDRVPVDQLMERLAQCVTESPLLRLIHTWLEHGATLGRGLPQGSPLSPVLANLYLDCVDEAFVNGPVRIVRYADDFVLLAKDRPAIEAARGKIEKQLARLGLVMDGEKTAIRDYDESLRFLGHLLVRGWAMRSDGEGDDDPVARALRAVADADAKAADETARLVDLEGGEKLSGFDRGLRLLHVRGHGRRLGLRNLSFSVHAGPDEARPRGESELIAIHHTRVDRIELGPDVAVDGDTLRHAMMSDIPVAFVTGHGKTLGQMAPALAPHAARHLAQARHAMDTKKAVDLARLIVQGRLANQRNLLRRINHRRGEALVQKACVSLARIERRLPVIDSVASLRGWEGAGTAIYWRAFATLLLHGFSLPQRGRRIGLTQTSVMLDVAASLLARDMGAIVLSAGLHPGFGVLHAVSNYKDACVYDLVEEFRAGLVESVVLQAINGRRVSLEDFSQQGDGDRWRIGKEGMSALIRAYEDRAERAIEVPRLGQRMTWRRLMRAQADLYAAHCEGRAVYQPYILDN